MSFMRTLATLAIGFAAARGVDRYRRMGGMPGVKEAVKKAAEPGGMVDDLGAMAERMGLPGGAQAVRDMARRAGAAAETSLTAAEAGFGNLMKVIAGAAGAASEVMGGMAATVGGPLAGEMSEANARLMIRAMVMAARADGEIDAEEKAKIMAFLGEATDEERQFVEAAMVAPVDLASFAGEVSAEMRERVYATSLLVAGGESAGERAYLDRLAAALGLDAATRARLDKARGASA
jgi:uncharacterized membrane protein YebE (DUF533 family)